MKEIIMVMVTSRRRRSRVRSRIYLLMMVSLPVRWVVVAVGHSSKGCGEIIVALMPLPLASFPGAGIAHFSQWSWSWSCSDEVEKDGDGCDPREIRRALGIEAKGWQLDCFGHGTCMQG